MGVLREEVTPPPGTAPPAAPSPLINDDLSFSEGYQERVGEHANGSTFKNLPDVFKSVGESRAKITQLSEVNSTQAAELAQFKAGVKTYDTPESYAKDVVMPQMPEGIAMPDDLVSSALKFAQEKGISPEAAASFIEFQSLQAKGELDAFNTERHTLGEQAKAQIIGEVGQQDYEATIARAKESSEILGLNIDENTLLTTPNLVVNLSKLRAKVGEDALRSAGFETVTKSQAGSLAQADAIVNDKENPMNKAFWDQSDPLHDAAVEQHSALITASGG